MSERLENNPGELPELRLTMASGEFIATPFNSTLFTFLGRLACYDHVFLQTGDEEETTVTGTYVFNQHPVYQDLASFMVEHNYPMLLNRIEVPDCDINAWERMVSQYTEDLDEMPDWLGDGTT